MLCNVSGAAAIELALVTPILAAMAVGLADGGLAIAQQMRLNDSAHSGAQYGLVRNPIQGDLSGVIAAIGEGTPAAARQINVTLSCECADGAALACTATCADGTLRRRYLNISLTEVYRTLIPYPLLDPEIPLQSNVAVRLQ